MDEGIAQLRVILSTMLTSLCPIGVVLLAALFGGVLARLGARSDYISLSFYIAGEIADNAKDSLRGLLDSPPYNTSANASQNLDLIPSHFEATLNGSAVFASTAENFFNGAKNESANLLLKLRQVPSSDSITDKIKSQLTDYFTEMENFHVIMCTALDDTTEFILDSVQMLQNNILQFGDVRTEMLERSKTQVDEWCHNRCNEFLWKSAEQVMGCFVWNMGLTHDIYSITKMTTYHVMKMMEHRIQKLYNCFLFGNYPIRCRFVRNPEADFERLHTRVEELQMYNDKQKRKTYYNRQRGVSLKCIPENFPHDQMPESLKSCFYYAQYRGLEE